MQILRVPVWMDGRERTVPKVAKDVKEFATIVCATARKDILAKIAIRSSVATQVVEAGDIVIPQRVNVCVSTDTKENLVRKRRIVLRDALGTDDV